MALHQTIRLSENDLNDTLGTIFFKRGILPSTITVTFELPYIAHESHAVGHVSIGKSSDSVPNPLIEGYSNPLSHSSQLDVPRAAGHRRFRANIPPRSQTHHNHAVVDMSRYGSDEANDGSVFPEKPPQSSFVSSSAVAPHDDAFKIRFTSPPTSLGKANESDSDDEDDSDGDSDDGTQVDVEAALVDDDILQHRKHENMRMKFMSKVLHGIEHDSHPPQRPDPSQMTRRESLTHSFTFPKRVNVPLHPLKLTPKYDFRTRISSIPVADQV